jgi:predicted metal-binding membrane protein
MTTIARNPVIAVLLGAAAVAWVITIERMQGMDEGPATDLDGFGWYLGIWVTMTAAMMLPSTVRVAREVSFAVGYLAVWTVFGLAAYLVFRHGTSTDVAGVLVVAAGLYQLTPLKQSSLARCRTAHEGGAFRSGVAHGLDCVGSSGGLMVALFALGLMSLVWTAAIAAAIFAEKVLPRGPRLARILAVALVVLGIWIAVSPSTVPGLTEPEPGPAMNIEM